MRANVGDPTAEWAQQMLPGELAQALAPYMAPGDRNGAILVARIDNLYLGPSSGGVEPGGAPRLDEGRRACERGPRGAIAAEVPSSRRRSCTIRVPVDQALVQSNHNRVFLLAQAFAGWVPIELGLTRERPFGLARNFAPRRYRFRQGFSVRRPELEGPLDGRRHGHWLPGRQVLIHPSAIALLTVPPKPALPMMSCGETLTVSVHLTRQQIEASPDSREDEPCTRELEARL